MKVKMTVGHSPACYFVNVVDGFRSKTPFWLWWWFTGETDHHRDSLGRRIKGSRGRWLVLACNCARCDARLIVNEKALLAEMSPALKVGGQ